MCRVITWLFKILLYYFYPSITFSHLHMMNRRPLSYVCSFISFFILLKPRHRNHATHSPSPPLRDVGSKSNQSTRPAIVKDAVAGHRVAENNTTASISVRPPFDKIQTHAFGDFRKPCHSRTQRPRRSEMTGDKPWFRDIRAWSSRVWNGFQRAQARRWGQSDRWMTLRKMWGESCCEDESILT